MFLPELGNAEIVVFESQSDWECSHVSLQSFILPQAFHMNLKVEEKGIVQT
jgi:hypothetical protein